MTRLLINAHFFIIFFVCIQGVIDGQIGNSAHDSLLNQLDSPVDSIKLNALEKLTWELRFSDPIKGFGYAFEGLNLAESLKRSKDIATLHNFIGVLAIKIASYDKAKIHLQKAYHIADSLNILSEKAYALNNLGEIYYQTSNQDSAILFLRKAIDIFNSTKDSNGLAYGYNQMGLALRSQKKYDEAIRNHQLSLEIRKKLNHKYFIAKVYQNLGVDYLEKGDFVEARKCFEQIDQSQLDKHSYFSKPYLQILIGKTYDNEKLYETATKYYKDAFKQAQSIPLFTEMRDAAKLLSDLYKRQEFHQLALFYFNSYKIWDDSVKSSNLVEEYKQLEMKRAFDQQYKFLEYKMKQDIENQELKLYWNRVIIIIFIAFVIVLIVFIGIQIRNSIIIKKQNKQLLLQKADIETKNEELYTQNQQISEQNEAISIQRDELALANATKDKFFSIIAHDLRGPIGNLTLFFDVVQENYQDNMDLKLKEFFNTVKSSVQQTYTLLENLLTWAQLQNGTLPFSPAVNSLYSLVDNNINLLLARANEKSIVVLNKLPKDLLLNFDSHMIDTVIRNLLSNAIKFTYPKGIIKICSSIKGNRLEISIIDSGIGMSQSDISRLFKIDVKHKSKEGTEGEKGTGLGLILCKEFIERHQGKIWVESETGKGSAFIFDLPWNINK
jgi:signal transduction histidine kinase